jgi:hypothetical protein
MRFVMLLALIAVVPLPALANPLTNALQASEPCQNLPHIDKTAHARIDAATLSMRGSDVQLTAKGSIRCRTSGAALIPSSASANFDLAVSGNLENCQFPIASVTLSNIDGFTGSLIENILVGLLRSAMVDTCQDLP